MPSAGTGPEVVLGLRPEALHLSEDGAIAATVIIVELLGAETHVISHAETGATGRRPPERLGRRAEEVGEAVRGAVDPDPASYHLFDAADGDRAGGHRVTVVATASARVGPGPIGRWRDGAPGAPVREEDRRRPCAPDGTGRRCWPTC